MRATARRTTLDSIFPKAPKTYEEYLKEEKIDYQGDYQSGVKDAKVKRAKSLAGYGVTAEHLGDMGLSGSGYAAYLDKTAEESYSSDLKDLGKKRSEAAEDSVKSYRDYLEDYEREQISTARSIRTELEKSGITDKSRLFNMARGMGADERYAEMISASVYEKGKNESFERLLPKLLTLGADYETARSLALEMGLDKSAAEELAERVKFYYNGYSGYADSYLKYLEGLGSLTSYSTLTGGK